MNQTHTIYENYTTNLDTLAGNRDNLTVGAENTHNKRFPTPVVKSVSFYQAFTPGVAGNKIPDFGKYLLADLLRFFQLPGAFLVPGKYVERISLLVSALKKRSNKKGTQVFSALIFRVPVVYPFTRVFAGPITVEGVAA